MEDILKSSLSSEKPLLIMAHIRGPVLVGLYLVSKNEKKKGKKEKEKKETNKKKGGKKGIESKIR